MTKEEATTIIDATRKTMYLPKSKQYISDLGYALDMAIEALEQEPCEDCIGRAELLSKIDAERKHLLDLKMDGAEHIVVHHARRIIEDMPPVTPQPKVGKWLEKEIHGDNVGEWQSARCSICDKYHTTPYMYYFGNYKFCPNCGARMEVEG